MDLFSNLEIPPALTQFPHANTVFAAVGLLLLAWVVNWVVRRILLRVIGRIAESSSADWDDALMAHGVLSRLVQVVPALIIAVGVTYIPEAGETTVRVVRNVAQAYVVLAIALAISNLLNALNDIYVASSERARSRPIKGYLQVFKIVVFVLATVLIVAALIEKSPLLLLSGFGAMSAVLLLVFKDSILSLVASVQLASNDMLRVGDWIQMPSLEADGDVIDMALNTVKVQNWDKTITTIPTHRLISESFKNWRGMSDAGGRRIKRSLLIDQSSVRFLDHDERQHLRRIALIDEYLDQQREELAEHNAQLEAAGKDPVNNRRATNLGTFRAYILAYLKAHPDVHQGMTLMARQLAPGATGIPLEVYCFSADTGWTAYENLQGDIFDHLLAVVPEFGLRVYQQPAGADITRALAARDEGEEAALEGGSADGDPVEGEMGDAGDAGESPQRASRPDHRTAPAAKPAADAE